MAKGLVIPLVIGLLAGALVYFFWTPVAGPSQNNGDSHGEWELWHEDSVARDNGYDEVWVIVATGGPEPAWTSAGFEIWIDDERVVGTWDLTSGGMCSRFTAWRESTDTLRPMTLRHHGEPLWHGTFGSGSGTPVQNICPLTPETH